MKEYTREELINVHQIWWDRIPKIEKIAYNPKLDFETQTRAVILVHEMIRRLPLINYTYENNINTLEHVFKP